MPRKGRSTVQTPENESEQIQRVTHRAKHRFQWSRSVATCACGYWTRWRATLESAKRNWSHHFEESYLASVQRAAKRGPMTSPLRTYKRLYTIREAGEYLGRSVWAIRRLIWGGTLPPVGMVGVSMWTSWILTPLLTAIRWSNKSLDC